MKYYTLTPTHVPPLGETFFDQSRGVEIPVRDHYRGSAGGYVAVYSKDAEQGVCAVGGGIYLVGLLRLAGEFRKELFCPQELKSENLSSDPEVSALCDNYFPGSEGGCWAGGDTGRLFLIKTGPIS